MKTMKSVLVAILMLGASIWSNAMNSNAPADEIQASILKGDKESVTVRVNNASDEKVKVEIKDKSGAVLYTKVITNKIFGEKYNFSNLPEGVYTILVTRASGVVVSKELSIYSHTSREVAIK